MKTLPILAALALVAIATPANAQPKYGLDAQRAVIECTGRDISAAFRGDWSNWVLPDWIGGNHLRAGQISKCPGAGR